MKEKNKKFTQDESNFKESLQLAPKSQEFFKKNEGVIDSVTKNNDIFHFKNKKICRLKEFMQDTSGTNENNILLSCLMCGKPTGCDNEECVIVARNKLPATIETSSTVMYQSDTNSFLKDYSVLVILNESPDSSVVHETVCSKCPQKTKKLQRRSCSFFRIFSLFNRLSKVTNRTQNDCPNTKEI